jgi:hypothetical protein
MNETGALRAACLALKNASRICSSKLDAFHRAERMENMASGIIGSRCTQQVSDEPLMGLRIPPVSGIEAA